MRKSRTVLRGSYLKPRDTGIQVLLASMTLSSSLAYAPTFQTACRC
jgi:hypothetical protein